MTAYQARVYEKESEQLICWLSSFNLKDVKIYAEMFVKHEMVYVKIFNEKGEELNK